MFATCFSTQPTLVFPHDTIATDTAQSGGASVGAFINILECVASESGLVLDASAPPSCHRVLGLETSKAPVISDWGFWYSVFGIVMRQYMVLADLAATYSPKS